MNGRAEVILQSKRPIALTPAGRIIDGAMHTLGNADSCPVKAICTLLTLLFVAETTLLAGVGSKSTMYVGGTITTITEQTEGTSSTTDEKAFIFNYKDGRLAIPYDRINTVEYGQKAGRRVGLAIAVSPIALLSKKRKHFLTINYTDDSEKQQAAVFEIGKDVVRTTLASLEARTGRKVEYQDEEARKSGKGN